MNKLKNSLEFSRIIEVFDDEIEQNEINRIFNSSRTLLELIGFCNNQLDLLESEFKLNSNDNIIKTKLNLYLAFLEQINLINKVDINKKYFYDEKDPLFKKEFKEIFSTSIYDI